MPGLGGPGAATTPPRKIVFFPLFFTFSASAFEDKAGGLKTQNFVSILHHSLSLFLAALLERRKNSENLRNKAKTMADAFVGEQGSLEVLDLVANEKRIDAKLDVLIRGCPSLRLSIGPKGPKNWDSGIAGAHRSLQGKVAREKPGRQSVLLSESEAVFFSLSSFLLCFRFLARQLVERENARRGGSVLSVVPLAWKKRERVKEKR